MSEIQDSRLNYKIENSTIFGKISEIPNVRSTVISIGGKVFHTMISGNDGSLVETGEKYLNKTGTILDISDKSKKELDEFKKNNKGIIILAHESGNFSDYLPIFKELGYKILKKSIFFTGNYNLNMNRREFPDYDFRGATPKNKKEIIELISNIENDIEKIKNEGGYIFIIPSGDNIKQNGEFRGIFKKMIKLVGNDFPILSSKVHHEWNTKYLNILKELTPFNTPNITNIQFQNTTSELYSGQTGKEMRYSYEKLFKKKD